MRATPHTFRTRQEKSAKQFPPPLRSQSGYSLGFPRIDSSHRQHNLQNLMHTVKTNHLGVERWDFCTLDRGFEIEPYAGGPHPWGSVLCARVGTTLIAKWALDFSPRIRQMSGRKLKDMTSGRVKRSLTTPAVRRATSQEPWGSAAPPAFSYRGSGQPAFYLPV